MKDFLKIAGVLLCILVASLGIGWLTTANGLQLMKYFAPKFEAVRRETFEESKAHRQGMIQELENMRFEYEQADDEHKKALASIIRHRTADFENLPPHLEQFVRSLR